MTEKMIPDNGDPHEAGRNAANSAGQSPHTSHVVVPVKVQAGDGKERWLDYTCQNPDESLLSEVVGEVRRTFFLDDSTEIKICTSVNAGSLDLDVPLKSILSSMREGDHLIINIEMVRKSGPEKVEDGSRLYDPVEAVDKIRQVVNDTIEDDSASEVSTSFTIKKKNRVIVYPNDQVFINQHLLHVLKEHVERPLLIESTFLFIGVTLGAICSIFIALADDSLSPAAHGKYKAVLIACIGMLLSLSVLLYFIKSERKKVLRPIIEQLAASQRPSPAKGKEK